MAKKRAKAAKTVSSDLDLKVEYNDDAGTWDVHVLLSFGWVRVASECDEADAEQVADDLARWKRGE